jgi:phytoene dehydrogenase-like protein
VVKVNCALARLPEFTAAPGHPAHVYRAQVEVTGSIDETQAACAVARGGGVDPVWAELYFQTAYDPTVAPRGAHTMSVFAQYAPYTVEGGWPDRRAEIGARVLAAVARVAPDVGDCIVEHEVLGPPDVEARTGLTGGHIFQGECLPDQMWDRRFTPDTGIPGLYLCGAATHPGGSVIAVNGRNAAAVVDRDLDRDGSVRPPSGVFEDL